MPDGADAKTRPRIALVATREPAWLRAATARAALHGIDVVVVGREPAALASALGFGPETTDRPGDVGDALARARAKRSVAVAALDAAPEAALDLVRAGHADALVTQGGAQALERLAAALGEKRWRRLAIAGTTRLARVAEPAPLAELAKSVDEERVRETVALVAAGLAREVGIPKPRLAVTSLDPEGSLDRDRTVPACARARELGIDVTGPVPIEVALRGRFDALIVTTRDHAALALAQAGPVVELAVGLPLAIVAPRAEDDEGSWAAALVLAGDAARARGELAHDREEAARKARERVAVVSRAPKDDVERCPYCRRAFDPDEPRLRCARCDTPHHRACLHEHGQCTVLACGGDRAKRHGREYPIAHLGGGELIVTRAFVALEGDGGAVSGPRTLRVEVPIDDPQARPSRRRIALELAQGRVTRGERLEGALLIEAPNAWRALGGRLRLRAVLRRRGPDADRETPILDREALVFGRDGGGVVARLSAGVADLWGGSELVEVPQGTRRIPFDLVLAPDHPASVRSTGRGGGEVVVTTLEALVSSPSGELRAETTLEVQAR